MIRQRMAAGLSVVLGGQAGEVKISHRATLPAVLLAASVAVGCAVRPVRLESGAASSCLRFRLAPDDEMPLRTWKQCSGFEFNGQAGEVITIKVTSKTPGLDPNVRLFDPKGAMEASDDDSGGNGNALIKEHLLLLSGTYQAVIGTERDQDGDVSVLLETRPSIEPGTSSHDPIPRPVR